MIKYIITDCDGTLTDGKNYINSKGEMTKNFKVNKDGAAVRMFKEKGFITVMITSAWGGQSLFINKLMASYMGFDHFIPAKVGTKLQALKQNSINMQEALYIGDGRDDMECLKAAKYRFCPADAVQAVIDLVIPLRCKGGEGVLMEIYERKIDE